MAPILDKVYAAYFVIHVLVLFCVDLVPFYPESLWNGPDAPLAILGSLRTYYLETYKDQNFVPPVGSAPPFFRFFTLLELLVHLPISLWAVGYFLRPGPASSLKSTTTTQGTGEGELILLLYGLETALTTATCMWDAWFWDEALITAGQKLTLVAGLYAPYSAVAALLGVDMYLRLLGRLNTASNASVAKKAQ